MDAFSFIYLSYYYYLVIIFDQNSTDAGCTTKHPPFQPILKMSTRKERLFSKALPEKKMFSPLGGGRMFSLIKPAVPI